MSKNSILYILFTAFIVLFSQFSLTAEAKIVKVGYYSGQEKFQNGFSDSAHKSGYAYEYYQDISRITGIKYTYEYGTYEEIYEKLINGQVDVLAGIYKSKDRENLMLFTKNHMGIESTYICIKDTELKDSTVDAELLKNKTIGVLKHNPSVELVTKFKETSKIDFNIKIYDTDDELLYAIENNKVDGSPMVNNRILPGFIPVSIIGESKVYFAINKNRPDLVEDFDYGIQKINRDVNFYITKLQEKYYFDKTKGTVLTQAEKDYLKDYLKDKKLKIGCLTGSMPYCDVDIYGNSYGVIDVIKNWFSDYLGIPVEIIPYEYTNDMTQALKNKEIDFLFPKYEDLWFAEQDDTILTKTIFKDNPIFIFKGEYRPELAQDMALAKKSVGENIRVDTVFAMDDKKVYENYYECLKAVLNGEATGTYMPLNIFYRLLNENDEFFRLNRLYSNRVFSYSLAASHDNYELTEIINKAISSPKENIFEQAINENMKYKQKYSFARFVSDNIIVLSVLVLIFILIIVLFFTFALKLTIKHKREIENINKDLNDKISIIEFQNKKITIDALTQINNRYQFEKYMNMKISHFIEFGTEKIFMAIMDLDFFKKINDTFGHPEGDNALVLMAETMRKVCDNTKAFIARYGGDEFVIVSSNIEELNKLCEEIQLNLDEVSKNLKYHMHISYGISEYTLDMGSLEELVNKADKELYIKKQEYHKKAEKNKNNK